jgi:glycosyltransferase involved in cell wall biosynthesis
MPVYNESECLAAGVRSVASYLEQLQMQHEIIIVESGSTDRTGEIADEISRELPSVRVIHEGRRNGFGSGLKIGYRACRFEWVWLVTPDLPFPLGTLEQALPLLSKCDAVLSYRSDDNRALPRRIQSFCFQKLVSQAFGLRLRCVNSAFKLIRGDFVRSMSLRSNGWTIDTELACLLVRSGCRCAEIGVPLTERSSGASKVTTVSAVNVLRDLARLWLLRDTLVTAWSPAHRTAEARGSVDQGNHTTPRRG